MTMHGRRCATARPLRRLGSIPAVLAIVAQLSGCAATGRSTGVFWARAQPAVVEPVHFMDATGSDRKLEEFRGRTVLLNVWAPWCRPCVQELPALQRLQAEIGEAEFAVVAMAVDRKGPALLPSWQARFAVDELELFVDPSLRSVRALGAKAVPTSILIDPQGRELARVSGLRHWDSPAVVQEIRGYMAKARMASAGAEGGALPPPG